ncbi:unnamed protein product [Haemonchus placei]|uniref:Uncharacterized protein n=1 Tax=Haemonchus placei TaxID=6290 RepID=A0A3P7VW62_HAEPC|nr:unnamed protein product [Haemonchus placei]
MELIAGLEVLMLELFLIVVAEGLVGSSAVKRESTGGSGQGNRPGASFKYCPSVNDLIGTDSSRQDNAVVVFRGGGAFTVDNAK